MVLGVAELAVRLGVVAGREVEVATGREMVGPAAPPVRVVAAAIGTELPPGGSVVVALVDAPATEAAGTGGGAAVSTPDRADDGINGSCTRPNPCPAARPRTASDPSSNSLGPVGRSPPASRRQRGVP